MADGVCRIAMPRCWMLDKYGVDGEWVIISLFNSDRIVFILAFSFLFLDQI